MGGLFDIAFRDVITLALAAFMAAVVILIPWVNPPGEKSTDVEETKASGQLIFEIEWKPGLPVDVDMWVKAPGLVPVGYSNLGNQSCNLLRDDLGKQNDPLDGNHEQLVCRDLRRGEYVFNLHYFRGYIRQVGVRWAIRLYDGKQLKEILNGATVMGTEGIEDTLVRFSLDSNGVLLPHSVHKEKIEIRGLAGSPHQSGRPGR